MTCETAETGSSGWKSISCTWWYGYRCLCSFYCYCTPEVGVCCGQKRFSVQHCTLVNLGQGTAMGWGASRLQSTSHVLNRPATAAGSDTAPSGISPLTQTKAPVELRNFTVSSSCRKENSTWHFNWRLEHWYTAWYEWLPVKILQSKLLHSEQKWEM